MTWLANAILLLFVGLVLVVAAFRRIPVLDEFCEGVKEGGAAALRVFPTLLALMTAIAMLQASGVTDWLVEVVRPLSTRLGFPAEALPTVLLRPLSGSGSLAALHELLMQSGADSLAGLVAGVLHSSTDTTFYAIAMYFGYVGIKKTGLTLPAALLGDFTGIVLATLTVRLFT